MMLMDRTKVLSRHPFLSVGKVFKFMFLSPLNMQPTYRQTERNFSKNKFHKKTLSNSNIQTNKRGLDINIKYIKGMLKGKKTKDW